MITPERMHYQAIEVPAPKPRTPHPWRVWTPRPRLFKTLDDAKLYAEVYHLRTGRIVAVEFVGEEVRR